MDPFIGEIRAFAFAFVPFGWTPCDGRLVQISENGALYAVLGTRYGGDGIETFALPNLQGAALVGQGSGPGLTPYQTGDTAGETTVVLTLEELPAHSHTATAKIDTTGTANMHSVPQFGDQLSRFAGADAPGSAFNTPPLTNAATFAPGMVQPTGAPPGMTSPHSNQQPYLSMIYCIATRGIYPARN